MKAKLSVYRNLNNGLLSIKYKGLVVGHCTAICLEYVSLHTNRAGCKRVFEGGNKEVCGWAKGLYSECIGFQPYKGRHMPLKGGIADTMAWDKRIHFDPKRGLDWIDEDGYVVEKLAYMSIHSDGYMEGADYADGMGL